MGLSAPWDDTYLHNCKIEELSMIELNPINVLMMKGEISKPAPLPRHSKKLQGKQIRMYGLYTSHRQFANTHEDKFQDQ